MSGEGEVDSKKDYLTVQYEAEKDGGRTRSCTDVVFLALFAGNIVLMIWILAAGLEYGDPERYYNGDDSYGNVCNRNNKEVASANLSGRDFRDIDRVFYFEGLSLISGNLSDDTRVCVRDCPNETIISVSQLQAWSNTNNASLCRYDVAVQDITTANLGAECPPLPVTQSSGVVLNRCLPGVNLFFMTGSSIFRSAATNIRQISQSLVPAKCDEFGSLELHLINDIRRSGEAVAYLSLLACFIAYVMIVILSIRFITKFVVWGLIISILFIGFTAMFYLWWQWFWLSESFEAIPEDERIPDEEELVRRWMYGAIVMTVLEVILLLLVIFFCNRIRVATLLITESGRALMSLPFLLFQPFVTVGLYILFVLSQCYALLFLFSAQRRVVDTATGRVRYEDEQQAVVGRWIYIFCVLWFSSFIFACESIYNAAAVSDWYFTFDKRKFRCCRNVPASMCWAYWITIRYHLGTAALGSLIIAIIQFIRLLIYYYKKMFANRQNVVLKKIFECTQCILTCFQKCMEYLTYYGYIVTAITGKNLCSSALEATSLLAKHFFTANALFVITRVLFFICKVGIIAIVEIAAFYYFRRSLDLCFIAVPLVILAFISYLLATIFFSVLNSVIDTMFFCFCVDVSENNGETRPYYMDKDLMKLMDLVNKEVAKQQKSQDRGDSKNIVGT